MKLLISILVFISIAVMPVMADDDADKRDNEFKTNEKAYEMANGNAKFIRSEDWEKDKKIKDKDDNLEDEEDKGKKKVKKVKKYRKSKY